MSGATEARVLDFQSFLFRTAPAGVQKIFAVHTGTWIRYRRLLSIIAARHVAAAAALVTSSQEAGMSLDTAADIPEPLRERHRLNAETLHLEVESFYLFAKILLDRMGDTLLFFLKEKPWRHGSSYNHLLDKKKGPMVLAKLGAPPPRLVELSEDLKRRVGDVRTYLIEHQYEARWMRSTTVGWEGVARMRPLSTLMYATESERKAAASAEREAVAKAATRETEAPEALLPVFDELIHEVIGFMERNVANSIIRTL
jgi:hypothetical protein